MAVGTDSTHTHSSCLRAASACVCFVLRYLVRCDRSGWNSHRQASPRSTKQAAQRHSHPDTITTPLWWVSALKVNRRCRVNHQINFIELSIDDRSVIAMRKATFPVTSMRTDVRIRYTGCVMQSSSQKKKKKKIVFIRRSFRFMVKVKTSIVSKVNEWWGCSEAHPHSLLVSNVLRKGFVRKNDT